jgi:hypothetical protein
VLGQPTVTTRRLSGFISECRPASRRNRVGAISRQCSERLFGAVGTTDPNVRQALRREDRSILDAVNQDVGGQSRRATATDSTG